LETQAKQGNAKHRETDGELADVLTAISVVSKRLARKLTTLSQESRPKEG
jgi:hypothetical protein